MNHVKSVGIAALSIAAAAGYGKLLKHAKKSIGGISETYRAQARRISEFQVIKEGQNNRYEQSATLDAALLDGFTMQRHDTPHGLMNVVYHPEQMIAMGYERNGTVYFVDNAVLESATYAEVMSEFWHASGPVLPLLSWALQQLPAERKLRSVLSNMVQLMDDHDQNSIRVNAITLALEGRVHSLSDYCSN